MPLFPVTGTYTALIHFTWRCVMARLTEWCVLRIVRGSARTYNVSLNNDFNCLALAQQQRHGRPPHSRQDYLQDYRWYATFLRFLYPSKTHTVLPFISPSLPLRRRPRFLLFRRPNPGRRCCTVSAADRPAHNATALGTRRASVSMGV